MLLCAMNTVTMPPLSDQPRLRSSTSFCCHGAPLQSMHKTLLQTQPQPQRAHYFVDVGTLLSSAAALAAHSSVTPKNSACSARTATVASEEGTMSEIFVLLAPWLIIFTLMLCSSSTPNTCTQVISHVHSRRVHLNQLRTP